MATSTRWAILLCKFSDKPQEPQPPQYFRTLFAEQGAGMGGLFDYWRDISYGTIDLTDTDVFGWFELDHTLEEDRQINRWQRIQKGIKAAVDNGVDLAPYFGIIVVLNVPKIDFGSVGRPQLTFGTTTKTYGLVVLDVDGWGQPTAAAHEMGHGYGLDHSWSAIGPDIEYGDPWDIMSAMGVYPFTNAKFGTSGPGLNAPYLQQMGWMPADRVTFVNTNGPFNEQVTLAALGHPEVQGPLMARFDQFDGASGQTFTYTIEYRHKDRWDAGIPQDVVLVHEVRVNGLSYLKTGLTPPGSTPAPGAPRPDQYVDALFGFGVTVEAIDASARQAQVRISSNALVQLSGGVETVSKQQIGSGIYHFPGTKVCPQGDFSYTRQLQDQLGTFRALTEFFDQTVTREWFLGSTLLYEGGSNVSLSVASRSALPPPSGVLTYGDEVVIDYAISGGEITLQNRPEDGTYDCVLRVVAKDSTGRTASDQITLTFLGDVLDFESKYYDAMEKCLMKTKGVVSKIKTKPKPFRRGCDPGVFKQKKKKIADAVRAIGKKRPGMADSLEKAFGHIPGVAAHSGLPKRSSKKKKKPKQKPKKTPA